MKKSILSSILLLSTSSIFASTTMCYKDNHNSMSTIENTKLDGGVCNGQKSVNDMKKEGWIIDDIKIQQSNGNMNFIYILKQPSNTAVIATEESSKDMEARIIANIEKKKEAEENAKKTILKKELEKEGQAFYTAKCQSCHGSNGEEKARGISRPINTLSLEEMQTTIRDYTQGTYNRGLASVMIPMANSITFQDVRKVYTYLKSVNNK